MSVHIIDSFPSPLYRSFDEEEHALSFIEDGSFLMRPLHYYHEIEDSKRKDRDEGDGRVVINMNRPIYVVDSKSGQFSYNRHEFGPVYFGTTSINPRYLLCFSGPQVDVRYLADKYGQYVCRLCKPDEFVRDVASYLEQRPGLPSEMWLRCVQVRYDKDQSVEELPEPASEERITMSYGQKKPKFSRECEYRLVLTLPVTGNEPPAKIRVKLHKRLEYAEIVAPIR